MRLRTPFGRTYAFYIYNADNRREVTTEGFVLDLPADVGAMLDSVPAVALPAFNDRFLDRLSTGPRPGHITTIRVRASPSTCGLASPRRTNGKFCWTTAPARGRGVSSRPLKVEPARSYSTTIARKAGGTAMAFWKPASSITSLSLWTVAQIHLVHHRWRPPRRRRAPPLRLGPLQSPVQERARVRSHPDRSDSGGKDREVSNLRPIPEDFRGDRQLQSESSLRTKFR